MPKKETPVAVIGAIAANAVIAVAKFGAGMMTGSSSMLSEGIHSTVDTGNEFLMLLGNKRSTKGPDPEHPFGYGQELYFWSLVVAIALFGIGGGMGILEGAYRVLHPEQLEKPLWSYLVLGIAFVAEGTSWSIAMHQLMKERRERNPLSAIHRSKNPSSFVVVMEDTAALLGILVAAAGVYLSHALRQPVWMASPRSSSA